MRRRVPFTVAALALTLLATTPEGVSEEDCRTFDDRGTPDEPEDDVGICTVDYWLSCDGAIAGKVNAAVPPLAGGNAQLTRTEPTTSFTAGAGCGEWENSTGQGVTQDNIHDFTFQGPVRGNIDAVTVELHDIYAGPQRENNDPFTLGVRFAIDGVSPWGVDVYDVAGTMLEAPKMITVTVQPEVSSTGASVAYRFTVTNLHAALNTARDTGYGPDRVRELKITVDTPEGVHAIVWGASEVPSGVTLNPSEPAGTLLVAPA